MWTFIFITLGSSVNKISMEMGSGVKSVSGALVAVFTLIA